MLPLLTASYFVRFMSSGRTGPVILGCEGSSGNACGEYVVKLRGGIEHGELGLLCELLGARLANHFGITTPGPALVRIEQTLADLIADIEPTHARKVRDSVGLNFGTSLAVGYSTWPVDRSIPEAMWQMATDIFAFDALLQNPDRRCGNPNLLTKGDSLLVFDHEMAFSFLLDLLPSPTPWMLDGQRYLVEHVFYQRLKSKLADLSAFTLSLTGLSDAVLAGMSVDVPSEWNNGNLPKIEQHLRSMREHAAEFAESVRRFLV